MFKSNIFIEGATWDPYRVRNILTISVEDKVVLSNIPGWCKENYVVQAEEDNPPVLEIQSADTKETKTRVTAEKIKWSKEKEACVAKIEKDKLSIVKIQSIDSTKTQTQTTVKEITSSTDKCNKTEHDSNLSQSAFRINEYKMNANNPNVKCGIDDPKQNGLQETSIKSSAEHFTVANKKMEIIPEAISLNGKLSVNENALKESVDIENNTPVSMFVQESKSDVRGDDVMISQEIPCAQPVASDSNPFSSLGASSQLVTEVHTVSSMDLKEPSQIVAVNAEPSVKSEERQLPPEKMSELKASRKRKHTKDRAQKSSSDSKSSRKPDIYYSSSELEKILSSLKLCLRLPYKC